MKSLSLFIFMCLMLVTIPAMSHAEKAEYVGVDKCKTCHKKENQGEQTKIWEKSGHAKAFKTLATKEAKEAAAKVGVKGDPQKSEACLVCHTTGFGEDAGMFDKKFDVKDGVQCESCHGPGSLYRKKKVMKAIWEERGEDRKGDSPTAKKTGFLIAGEETCKRCHVKELKLGGKTYTNPQYKDFDYDKYLDKIKHPVPK